MHQRWFVPAQKCSLLFLSQPQSMLDTFLPFILFLAFCLCCTVTSPLHHKSTFLSSPSPPLCFLSGSITSLPLATCHQCPGSLLIHSLSASQDFKPQVVSTEYVADFVYLAFSASLFPILPSFKFFLKAQCQRNFFP